MRARGCWRALGSAYKSPFGRLGAKMGGARYGDAGASGAGFLDDFPPVGVSQPCLFHQVGGPVQEVGAEAEAVGGDAVVLHVVAVGVAALVVGMPGRGFRILQVLGERKQKPAAGFGASLV